MPVTLADLEFAFMGADSNPPLATWIHMETGEILTHSDYGDGGGPPPDDEPGWIEMPSGRDWDLKRGLVNRFVANHCPQLEDQVHRCFSRRGAWRAYKDLLDERGLRDNWHSFRDEAIRRVLTKWAAEEGIVIVDKPAPS